MFEAHETGPKENSMGTTAESMDPTCSGFGSAASTGDWPTGRSMDEPPEKQGAGHGAPPPVAGPHAGDTLAGRLVADRAESPQRWAARTAIGLLLSSLFGLALGARSGGTALLEHAVLVPLGLILVLLVGIPALIIGLALVDSPVRATHVVEAAVASIAAAGLLLAGLAPATAFFVITTFDADAATVVSGLVLSASGILSLRLLLRVIETRLDLSGTKSWRTMALCGGFCLFAFLFVARVWSSTLPVFGGAL
jgi:hypothetical protein